MKGFASDNYAGIVPEALAAIAQANDGHASSYGNDPWTARAREAVREALGAPRAEVFLVFNGTAANVLCLEALLRPWESVITTTASHLHVDECGAPEAVGIKLLTVPAQEGKLRPEAAERLIVRVGDEHATQPRVLSIAQSTELGTVYDAHELAELRALCDERGLRLHVDGARLPIAAAARGCSLGEACAGADAISLGGTKAGLLGVEAVVLRDPDDAQGFAFRRKRRAQLASKMRFASAQLEALLRDGVWERHASHANAMARRLADAVRGIDGVRVTQPVEANVVFAVLDPAATAEVQERFPFYVWDEATGEVRWMCSWDTEPDEVDAFAAAIAAAVP
jgi:threonine aldolase